MLPLPRYVKVVQMRRQLLLRDIKKINFFEQLSALDSKGRAAVILILCSVNTRPPVCGFAFGRKIYENKKSIKSR